MSLLVLFFGLIASAPALTTSTAQGILGVVNKDDGTASFINLRTGDTQTVAVGLRPHEVVIGNGTAYVSNYGSAHIRSSDLKDVPGNTLSVVQLAPPYTVTALDLGATRCAPHGLVLSKGNKRLYVTCEGRHEIAVIDTEQKMVSHFLPTNQAGSHLLVLSPDESRLYVTNFWLGTVSTIDVASRKLLKQIRVGRGCEGIGISADGENLFVSRVEDGEVLRIDTRTLEVVQRRTLATGSSPIRVIPGTPTQLLVNDVGAGKMLILNPQDLTLIKEIKVGTQPIGLAASNGHHAFAANMRDKTVSVINLNTFLVEAEFPTGASPDGIAYAP